MRRMLGKHSPLGLALVVALLLGACEAESGRSIGDSCTEDAECASGVCWEAVCLDTVVDADGDGVLDHVEARLGTNPSSADTDGDGIDDLREIRNPRHPVDTDGDGIIDALESAIADQDDDCIPDQADAENDVQSVGARNYRTKECLVGVCAEPPVADHISVGCEGGRLVCRIGELPAPYIEEEVGEDGCFDGLDNDCDGQTDEGSPDHDGDLTPDCADDDDDDDGTPDVDDCLPFESRCGENCVDADDDGEPDCMTLCPGVPAVFCDDAIDCTVDACDDETGCFHAPDDGRCDDLNPCTDDQCDPAVGCLNIPNSLPCDADDDACTDGDACLEGECVAGEDLCGCRVDADCGAEEDGDLCNGTLRCDTAAVPYACVLAPATVVTCSTENDTECAHAVCDPATGGCPVETFREGLPCEDGNVCTSASTCQSGQCLGVGDLCECESDNDCVEFDDGNLCNGYFICELSNPPYHCVFEQFTIPAACERTNDSDCMSNQCVPATGECEMQPRNEAGACDDALDCTGAGECEAGLCQPGVALTCDDGLDCTIDSCEEGTGCVHTPDDSSCDDGDPCTANVCDATDGCVFPPDDAGVCDDGDDCTTEDHCDGGACVGTPECECQGNATDCLPFEDGDRCNGTLLCDTSSLPFVCVVDPATVVTCDTAQDTVCRRSTCTPATGVCALRNVNEDGVCDDGDPCTLTSFCGGGQCLSGNDVCDCRVDDDCALQEDGNRCNGTLRCNSSAVPYHCEIDPATVVTCDTSGDTTCEHTVCVQATGACVLEAFNEGADCDDGDPCTAGDACLDGLCTSTGPTDCGDGNDCTSDPCDAAGCHHVEVADGDPCEDGEPCTSGDTCAAGICVAGGATDCDDGDSCTVDACTDGVGCTHADEVDDTPCEDGDLCTGGDVCLAGVCVTGPDVPSCDDRRACTVDDCDPAIGCTHVPDPTQCNDTVDCTLDTCSAESGCVFTPDDTACDDSVACTTDTCDPSGGCQSVADDTACDDSVDCTVDTCDALDGCANTPDDGACDDSVDCTADVCDVSLGRCANTPVADDCPADGNPCTDATCDATLGCRQMDGGVCVCQGLAFAGAAAERVWTADAVGLSGGPGRSLSIEAWVKPDAVDQGEAQLVSKLLPGTGGDWALLQSDADFVFQFYPQGSTSAVRATAAGAFGAGTWTHVAVVFDNAANSLKLYVNGSLRVPQGIILDIEDSAADVFVGPNPNAPMPAFAGTLDEVRVWSVARDGLQIGAAFDAVVSSSASGIVSRWAFDDVGTATADGAADFIGAADLVFEGTPPTAGETAPLATCP